MIQTTLYAVVECDAARRICNIPEEKASTRGRYERAVALYSQNQIGQALEIAESLMAADSSNSSYRIMLATILTTTGHANRAAALWAALAADYPQQPRILLRYGNTLRTIGRSDDAIAAYRACVEFPAMAAEAWWSLSNLKSGIFDQADIDQMKRRLTDARLSAADRIHIAYALGSALEDKENYPESWSHYAEGARLKRLELKYNGAAITVQVDATVALLGSRFSFEAQAADPNLPTPIFIVGLPRSGSTLIEQMLSSHPEIEGTMELPEIANILDALPQRRAYPSNLAAFDSEEFAQMGREYIRRARLYRETENRFFIDKMPNNWLHIAFILRILPHAKIVDARRNSMATCFSAFKQLFAKGQEYTYSQNELGQFYRDYLRMMSHWDLAFPGRVYRVNHEPLIDYPEVELRNLLAYCGVPFDPACLRFHESNRPVRTASSEQVRRPLFRHSMEQWRNYEPWLGPLKAAVV